MQSRKQQLPSPKPSAQQRRKKAKKALKSAAHAEKSVGKHVDGMDKAIGASKSVGQPTAGEQDAAAKTSTAKAAARKHGSSAGLYAKAKKIAASVVDPAKRSIAEALVVKARAALSKASAAHSDAKKAAHHSASKSPSKSKAAHDHAKIKRETMIQYKLGKREAMTKAVARDIAVLVKLKTADAAQAAIDMKNLASDLKKTPKIDLDAKQRAQQLFAEASAAQKDAEKSAARARKAEILALEKANTAKLKQEALDLLKKAEDEQKEDSEEIKKEYQAAATASAKAKATAPNKTKAKKA